ncbi:deoxyribose-phosphate aldolase [Candidatus Gastranaerophilales bacterium]|nr:MAG: deoxyribose-phosphate aldolase [Candidatus Gastranaerophilales bacterium]PWL80378.1 MAG: deoxyribose-phosphate aldolase [Candidatus Gastranaerophilales bacterium]
MENLNKHIEHTLLKQDAKYEDFIKLFDEAKKYNFLGVCVNPLYVKLAKEQLAGSNVKIVTVVGFPLGANKTQVKAYETQQAIEDGADEIDMVINVTAIKNKDYEFVKKDIETVKAFCQDKPLKVILETDLLDKDEIKKACEICVQAKADFVKTSTGFVKNGVGAKVEDVKLMYETVAPHGLRVKASGGIRDKQTSIKMLAAGAERLGTSSGVKIVE